MNLFSQIVRSLRDFRRHPWLHSLSILTITTALFIFGIFFLGYRNLDHSTKSATTALKGTLFLKEPFSQSELTALMGELKEFPGVKQAVFKNKDTVASEMSEYFGETSLPLMNEGGFLPSLIEVELMPERQAATIKALQGQFGQLPIVEEVDFSEQILSKVTEVKRLLKPPALFFMLGILIACSVLIANFMGMRHHTRIRDMEITSLVGASPRYIFLPFLWEGLIEGTLGALIALVGLGALYGLVAYGLEGSWLTLLGFKEIIFLSPIQLTALIVSGVVMALVGSFAVFFRFHQGQT